MAQLGFSSLRSAVDRAQPIEYVLLQRPLHRILAFTRRTIDDVVNDPIAKSEVLCYYKLHNQIRRSCEITALERQWNAVS